MKGIILPSGSAESFKPLTYQMPVGMLPIVNKPLMEHQVELLVRSKVKDVRLSCNHLSNKVESYFETGTRWGASLSYNFERPPFGSITALRQMRQYFQGETLVILDSDVITDIDLQSAIAFHRDRRADATFVCQVRYGPSSNLTLALEDNDRIHAVNMHGGTAATQHYADGGVCIIEPEILELLSDSYGYGILRSAWLASQRIKLNLFGYHTDAPLLRITNWETYYQVQEDILDGKFPRVQIPGLQVQKSVWVGKNVSVSSNVAFKGPLVIGDNCRIGRGVNLGRGTVIGHGVFVDSGASLERSIVLSKTFVGPHTAIKEAIMLGNLMIDIQKNSFFAIEDDLAATEMERGHYGSRVYHYINRAGAFLACVVCAPALALLSVMMLAASTTPLISRVRRMGVDLRELASGKLRLRVFDLFYIGPLDTTQLIVGHNPEPLTMLPEFIARLGNLWNVVRGDILFVGNRPMDPELAFSVTEEWRRTRFKCQGGLMSILDTKEAELMSEDEQIIAEGYYAVNRSFRMDAGIAANTAERFLSLMFRKRKKERKTRPAMPEEQSSLS